MRVKWKDFFMFFLGFGICRYFGNKVDREKDYRNESDIACIETLNRWMTLRDKKISIGRYLRDAGYRKVAIYGLGMIGNHLYEELADTDIEIVGIDRSEIYNNFRMPVYKAEESFGNVDLIIVTPIRQGMLLQDLGKKYKGRIMTFQQVLDECENYLY